jgi:hypothetical protein
VLLPKEDWLVLFTLLRQAEEQTHSCLQGQSITHQHRHRPERGIHFIDCTNPPYHHNIMTTYEVHLAIYDLSMGMAKNLSAQFLGQQHAIDIIPHTAVLVYNKEYFFGRGIEWCSPHEFRRSRGIHPIEVQKLGTTTCTEVEFEDWCRRMDRTGQFNAEAYDLLYRNCNTFSQEASQFLGVRSVPQWILDVPQRFLSSPMGMMVRPILEGMQMSNNAPTNLGGGAMGNAHTAMPTLQRTHHTPSLSSSAAAAAVNPWANIPSTTSTPTAVDTAENPSSEITTPLLDKQTGPLLSTDTGVVSACIAKLASKQTDEPSAKEEEEEKITSNLLSKLADSKASWTQQELQSVHEHLRSFIENGIHLSFALMLLRLAVLKHPSCKNTNEEQSISTELVAKMLLEEGKLSLANRSMAWCVLSNAIGSNNDSPSWMTATDDGSKGDGETFLQLIDNALRDCDPMVDGASSSTHVSLRQSGSAFLYNVARKLAAGNGSDGDGTDELSEATMSILIGCLENIGEETDVTALKRRYLCIGQLLKSPKFGKTAIGLVKDLGLMEDGVCDVKNGDVGGLSREISLLLTA